MGIRRPLDHHHYGRRPRSPPHGAGLHQAYRPYRLADKLIFVGKRFGYYLVIYDGRQIGPLFADVPIAYCCEGPLYALNMGAGRYLFRGKRAGHTYLVEITTMEQPQ